MLTLLADITSLYFKLDSREEPLGPMMVMRDRRSAIITDFSDEALDLLEAVVESIADPELKARIADVLWLRRHAATDLEGFRNLRGLIEQQWEANRAATGGHPWAPPAWAEIAADGCPLPPFKWDNDRRALLRAELDAYYARLYGLTRDELRYILDPKDIYGPDFPSETFRVLKEKEVRAFGEYRTRRLVLEAWDNLGSG